LFTFFRKFPHHLYRRVIYVIIISWQCELVEIYKIIYQGKCCLLACEIYIQLYASICTSLWEGKLIYLIICHKKWKIYLGGWFFKSLFFNLILFVFVFVLFYLFLFSDLYLGGGGGGGGGFASFCLLFVLRLCVYRSLDFCVVFCRCLAFCFLCFPLWTL